MYLDSEARRGSNLIIDRRGHEMAYLIHILIDM